MARKGSFNFEIGNQVRYQGQEYLIHQLLGLREVVLLAPDTGHYISADISDLEPLVLNSQINTPDLEDIPLEEWKAAMARFKVIEPLLVEGRTRQMVEEAAKANGVSTNTIYGWLRKYQANGKVTDLVRAKRNDTGILRTMPEVEAIIEETIQKEYLSAQKKSAQKVCIEVALACRKAGLVAPHPNTIRNRLRKLPPKTIAQKREQNKNLAAKYDAIEGEFPNANWPLSVVQIDHTPLDIILCDDHWRMPVGRPWITLVFDVHSRMVLGFYVSFDPPSALSTGLAIAHSVLPKEDWLAKYNVNGEWPCWGIPDKIHVDNAKEFRGNMLQRACQQYHIDIEWRPVARPNFGAHVERYLGTLAKELKSLHGATFSNISERGNYNSSKKATFTLAEFEEWLTVYIVGSYHNQRHSSIGVSPIDKFRLGILGNGEQPGKGLPAKIIDEHRFRLDFLPFEERTVQRHGLAIDGINYFHDILRNWINAPDPNKATIKRKFIIRRDPRDISIVWFYDPSSFTYHAIPYRNTAFPPISVWELRAAKSRLQEEQTGTINEDEIFATIDRMREIEEKALQKSKAARRSKQRRKHHSMAPVKPAPKLKNVPEQQEDNDSDDVSTIMPFDDLDEML